MRFGLDVSQHQLEWAELLRRVRYAEQAGFDGVWVFDHFRPLYGPREGPCMEGWSLLAALAAATERVRLGALVSGVTYRHPSVLAAQAATIDVISNGRLEIGIGAAWHEAEHRQLGIPFPGTKARAEMLEEAIQLMRLVLTRDRASFAGKHFRLERATYRPRPVQQPHPPIWVGASGEQLMLPIVARQADAWHGFGAGRELQRKSQLIDEHARRAGRDPKAILRSTSLDLSQPGDGIRRDVEEAREWGFAYLVVSWPSEGWGRLREFAERHMPPLT